MISARFYPSADAGDSGLGAAPGASDMLLARDPQYLDDIWDADLVLDPLHVGNCEPGHGIALRAEHGEADVHDTLDFIARAAFVAAPANLCKMIVQVRRFLSLRLIVPLFKSAPASASSLKWARITCPVAACIRSTLDPILT